MKFGRVLEYNKRVNHAENEARSYFQTSLFFKKVLNEVKASGLQLSRAQNKGFSYMLLLFVL